jgi:hypothetical protein
MVIRYYKAFEYLLIHSFSLEGMKQYASVMPHEKEEARGRLFDQTSWMHDLEQFQEKCAAVFRPELRENKSLERFGVP